MRASTSYQHSSTFQRLKGIEESIDGNLTSAQYLGALDEVLAHAYLPIIRTTSCFETFVATLIGWQEVTRKRKVSFLAREEFIPIALTWMLLPNREARAQQVDRLKIERAALSEFVYAFIDQLEDYEKACNIKLTDSHGNTLSIAEQLAYKLKVEEALDSPVCLLSCLAEARIWIEHYVQLKKAIFEKYVRLILKYAQSEYVTDFNHGVPLDDIIQGYSLAALRALDKCDPRQGVLTTHIRRWLYTARFQLLRGREDHDSLEEGDNLVAEGEDAGDEEASSGDENMAGVERARLIEVSRSVARLVDPEGYGRAYLGLSESTEYLESSIDESEPARFLLDPLTRSM